MRDPGGFAPPNEQLDAVAPGPDAAAGPGRHGPRDPSPQPLTRTLDPDADIGGPPADGLLGRWGRFELLRLLGEGGMGQVFEAWDPHLQRRVALKRLRDLRPGSVQRFLREGRAQARVQHESVCPIHEVGEVGGEPYLVMQLIAGQTLAAAAAGMTLERKLLTVIRVALAVHSAHREGLVHRDIKPGNIMVEDADGGEPRVYVTDFGIARPTGGSEVTTDGGFMGTPAYAAPEQVRGEGAALDRRTDVYGLGATLYRILSGAPPFEGSTSAVLHDVLEREPRPLRARGIPADVETIALTCLAKDPERRYPSARALAEDLQRFLDGDPILARPASLATRLRKKARKHRAVVAVALAAVLAVTAAVAWGGWSRWQAAARERLARDLTAQVERIEAEIRYSQLSPPHDVRPDRVRLQQRMAALEADVSRAGWAGQAAGHYALGRALLAREDLAAARRQLELAWSAGARDDRTALALGTTLGELYRERLPEVAAIADKELREHRRRELRRALQIPAVEYLARVGELDGDARGYVRAAVAFHQRRFDAALGLLAGHAAPWRHEVPLLRGDVHRERAQERLDQGDVAAAGADFDAALAAYADAARIAPSDLRGYLAAGHTCYLRMVATELRGVDAAPVLAAGLAQVEAARAVDPDEGRVYHLEALLLHRHAESLRLRHEDPEPALSRALEAADRAAALAAEPSEALLLAALIHTSQAQWRATADPPAQRAAFEQGLAALGRVGETHRGYRYFNTLGAAQASRGDVRAAAGEDARDDYERAIAAYRQAVALHPNPYAAFVNLHQCLIKLASLPKTEDRVGPLREAAAALEEALARRPQEVVPYAYNLGRCYLRLAQAGDPMTDLLEPASAERALHFYRTGQKANPKMPHFSSGIGEVLFLQGRQAWDEGRDPEPLFAAAEQQYREGIAASPTFVYLPLNLAWLHYFRGKLRVRAGLDPGEELHEALRAAERTLALQPHPGATLCAGSAHRILAEHEVNAGRDPRPRLAKARAAFAALLAANPEHLSAHRELARAWTLEAQWLAGTGRNPEAAFARAAEEMTAALALQPRAPGVLLAEARRCLQHARWLLARGRASDDLLVRGIEHAGRALAVRPGLAEAEAIRACLLLLRGRAGGAAANQAQDALAKALQANPQLGFEWGSFTSGPQAPARQE